MNPVQTNDRNNTNAVRPGRRGASAGFTLVELLAVIAVIFLLVAIIAVVSTGALRRAGEARTAALQRTIGVAIETFRNDLGYIPPQVLREVGGDGSVAEGVITPRTEALLLNRPAIEIAQNERYMSEYSLTVYLLGIGVFDADNAPNGSTGVDPGGYDGHDGVAGPGLKDPGRTRAWKDASELRDGNPVHQVSRTGRTYGPYLDFGALESSLAFDEERGLYQILDTFGEPIRYYTGWPTNDPNDPGNAAKRTVARVPIELWSPELYDAVLLSGSGSLGQRALDVDPGIDRALISAEFALLSAGDSRENHIVGGGEALAPFGDQTVTEDRSPLDIGFDGQGLVDFDASGKEGRERVLEFLESNVRYTP